MKFKLSIVRVNFRWDTVEEKIGNIIKLCNDIFEDILRNFHYWKKTYWFSG